MSPVILKQRQQQVQPNLGRRLPLSPSSPLLLSHRNGNESRNNITANPNRTYNDEQRLKHECRNGLPPIPRYVDFSTKRLATSSSSSQSGISTDANPIQINKFTHIQVLQQKFETERNNNKNGSKLTHRTVKMDRPCFLQKLEDKTVEEGQPVELLARVQGATSVSWIRSGKILPNCPDFHQSFVKIGDRESQCCLRIADVFTEDAGRFICKAYNRESGSTALCSARVTVTGRKIYKIKMSDKEDLTKSLSASSPPATRTGKNGKCESNIEVTETAFQYQNGTPEMKICEKMGEEVISGLVTSVDEIGENKSENAEKVEVPKPNQNCMDVMKYDDEPEVRHIGSGSASEIESQNEDLKLESEIGLRLESETNDLGTIPGEILDQRSDSDEIMNKGELESDSKRTTEFRVETPEIPMPAPVTDVDIDSTSIDQPEMQKIDSLSEEIDSESDLASEFKDLTLAGADTAQIDKSCEKSTCLDLPDGLYSGAQKFNSAETNLDNSLTKTPINTDNDEKLDRSVTDVLDENETQVEEILDKTLTEIQLSDERNSNDRAVDLIEETIKTKDGFKPQVMGPSYILALKGETVHLRIKISGNPTPTITWSRAGKLLEPDDRLRVEENGGFSSINVDNVSYDESGRYVAKVENEFGMVLHSTNLSVEGPPEPPSRSPSATFDERSDSILVSWSGAPYDGGSALTSYHLLVSQDEEEWTLACQSKWLTATVPSPDRGSSYRFRVHGENGYGLGPPSHVSIPVVIPGVCSITENSTNVGPEIGVAGDDVETAVKDTPIRLGSYLEVYEKGEELGKGRFGTVFKVTHKTTRKDFASKIIRCIKGTDKDKVRQEVEIMNLLRHPKLIELVDAFETAREIVIITEKINGGELFERVVADDFTLTEFDCVGFMRQIIDGVRFIHSKHIIHLDLKPENILCLTRSTYSIKIIDFGLSQKYDFTTPLRVLFGTPEFVAPEIINYEPISPASDMWALGVITYVLLSGLSPFMGDTDSETFANITAADFDFDDDSFASISSDAKEFIMSLLVKRQEKRMTADDCLSHKWLAYPEPSKNIVIPTDKLKRFIIRRKWQKTGNAIRALGRITMLYSTRRSSEQAAAAAAAANASTSGSVDSGISLSPTTTNPSLEFGTETRERTEEQSENKRLLQRQPRLNSSSSLS